ncbi:MAG: carbohydrate ABC transporter permease, partial [Niameybacter sp.]
ISLPAIATIGLFLTFSYWNDWYNALLFIDNAKLVPLQAMLNRIEQDIAFLNQNVGALGASVAEVIAKTPTESVKMAIVMLVVLPIACSYPYFQKYFISGLTIGGVKE